ncbi:MAG TPA: hypothetical protein VJ485_04390 [archaeon]|jgi:hypothetical protein|nr:hypothetical protein [archaeon]
MKITEDYLANRGIKKGDRVEISYYDGMCSEMGRYSHLVCDELAFLITGELNLRPMKDIASVLKLKTTFKFAGE